MRIFFSLFLFFAILNAEQSAFGAGDVTNAQAYGLSKNELLLREKLINIENEQIKIQSDLKNLSQQIEGLQSTLEGVNSQYAKASSNLRTLELGFENFENNISFELDNLKAYLKENKEVQDKNNEQIKLILKELSSLVNEINQNYVAQNEIKDMNLSSKNEVIALIKEQISLEKVAQKKPEKQDEWKKLNGEEILKIAIKEFGMGDFSSSQEKFKHLIDSHYKPARSNFYLGEIEFTKQNWPDALEFYKKSVQLNNGGDYFSRLLLHTGNCLEKLGQNEEAQGFYEALKESYPQSVEAKNLN